MDTIDFGVNIPEAEKTEPLKFDNDNYVISQWKHVVELIETRHSTKEVVNYCVKQNKFWDCISKLKNVNSYIDKIKAIVGEP